MNYVKESFFIVRLPLMLLMFILLSLIPEKSKATIILSTDATATIDSGPLDGHVYLVPESNPFYSFTVTGSASSEVVWKIGTEDDFLLNDMEYGDSDILVYLWRLTLDGVGVLFSDHSVIGGSNSLCGSTEWEDGQFHEYSCGIEPFSFADISKSATVGVGNHILQLYFTVVSTELEILDTDSELRTFTVAPIPEPSTILLLGGGLLSLGWYGRKRKKA